MGIGEVLTIIFVICKLVGIIDWSWFLVLLPEIVTLVIYLVLFIWQALTIRRIDKESQELFDIFKK